MSEKYKDKKVSIIGDSISTLPGYIPEGYAVYYDVENKNTDVHTPQDTWWGMLIAKLGATLLEDNAYSGSMVSRYPLQNTLFPSASSDERTSALHRGDEKPDVIIIYIGINDWNECLMPDREHVYPEDKRPEEYREREDINEDEFYFDSSYAAMLDKLKKNYPEAQICCCTLCRTKLNVPPYTVLPECRKNGYPLTLFNDIIRKTAAEKSCRVLDLDGYNTPYDSADGYHPTRKGMEMMADMMYRELTGEQDN